MAEKRIKCSVCGIAGATLCLDCRAIYDRMMDLQTLFGANRPQDSDGERKARVAEYQRRAAERKPLFEKKAR